MDKRNILVVLKMNFQYEMQFKFTHCGKTAIWIGDIFGSQQEHNYL